MNAWVIPNANELDRFVNGKMMPVGSLSVAFVTVLVVASNAATKAYGVLV